MSRADVSTTPPGGLGTIKVIALVGKPCAAAGAFRPPTRPMASAPCSAARVNLSIEVRIKIPPKKMIVQASIIQVWIIQDSSLARTKRLCVARPIRPS